MKTVYPDQHYKSFNKWVGYIRTMNDKRRGYDREDIDYKAGGPSYGYIKSLISI